MDDDVSSGETRATMLNNNRTRIPTRAQREADDDDGGGEGDAAENAISGGFISGIFSLPITLRPSCLFKGDKGVGWERERERERESQRPRSNEKRNKGEKKNLYVRS